MMANLAAAGVTHGDAIMLVDIGYNGTVQNMLEPLFAARMNLTVAGRYLFLREESLSGRDKRGFIDVRHYDCRTVHALSNCVAGIETVCNIRSEERRVGTEGFGTVRAWGVRGQ